MTKPARDWERDWELCQKATPGPWYPRRTDAEQIKALEREGKAGYLQHIRLVKEWEEMTGQKWGGEHGAQNNNPWPAGPKGEAPAGS